MRPSLSAEVIHYACQATPLGFVFAATTKRGVRLLHLIEATEWATSLAELGSRYPDATLCEDESALAVTFRHLKTWRKGGAFTTPALDLAGTPFRQKVWRALQQIPAGTTVSYSELARRAGFPKAVRAAASSCARNPVALFVPCHRIVRSDGGLGGYGGGLARKRRLLELEGVLTPV